MLKDTKTSQINLSIYDTDILKKTKCHTCGKFFTEKDIKENNYRFIVNYGNTACFNTKTENNKLEKKGDNYFLSLKVCWIEHKYFSQ